MSISISYKFETFQIFEKPIGDKFSYWHSVSNSPYHQKDSSDKKKNLKIQMADTEGKPYLKPVQLDEDYLNINRNLNAFYAKLDELIKNEYALTKKIDFKVTNELLSNFLEITNKEINLPQYTKSLIERIITDLDK